MWAVQIILDGDWHLELIYHGVGSRARNLTLRRWEGEEQAKYKMFEALMAGPGAGGGGGSRSSRKLLKAKARAVVTPDERGAMADLARQELVRQILTALCVRGRRALMWTASVVAFRGRCCACTRCCFRQLSGKHAG